MPDGYDREYTSSSALRRRREIAALSD